MASYTTKTKVRNMIDVQDTDVISDAQVDLAIDFAEDEVDNEGGIPDGSDDDKARAATYLAAHVCALIMRGGTAVIEDGDLRLESITNERTGYLAMWERATESTGELKFARAGGGGTS